MAADTTFTVRLADTEYGITIDEELGLGVLTAASDFGNVPAGESRSVVVSVGEAMVATLRVGGWRQCRDRGGEYHQCGDRSGKEVDDAVCGSCHAKGTGGAPRIVDEGAWAKRAAQGLRALSDHALKGIRNMPSHGGNPGLSDIEVERAIVYMVNQSGGKWIEPLGGATPALVRTSEQIVQKQCSKWGRPSRSVLPPAGRSVSPPVRVASSRLKRQPPSRRRRAGLRPVHHRREPSFS